MILLDEIFFSQLLDFRIDIVCGIIILASFALIYALIMNEGCDKIKEALENLHIDDCEAFKTGNL